MISFFIISFLVTYHVLKRLRKVRPLSLLERVGDELHIALAVLVGKLLTLTDLGAIVAAYLLFTGYLVYQIADYIENRDTISKDIAVFLASVSGVLTLHYGISIPV